jgi:hypothetical protein
VDRYNLIGIDSFQYIHTTADPMHFDTIDCSMLPQSKMQARAIVALVATTAVDFIHLVQIACDDPHVSANAVTVGLAARQLDFNPMLGVVRIVS